MDTITSGDWVADLDDMLCWNVNNKIVVEFERKGEAIIGQVKDMPLDLLAEWAGKPDGHRLMQEMIFEAESVFMHVCFENKSVMQNKR